MSRPDEPLAPAGRLAGELLTECALWISEQMEEEGYFLDSDLVELILTVEREEQLQSLPEGLEATAARLASALDGRGVQSFPQALTAEIVASLLDWEDQFLAFAAIPRSES
jgi:hypothetical protein